MKKYYYLLIITGFFLCGGINSLYAQIQTFEGNNIGDAFGHMGWGAADLEAVVAADPLDAGNKVLQNSVHNYNAAPVVPLVIPSGKKLSDYISFNFSAYFAQGDVGYKDIIVEAYQTAPTGPFNNNAGAKIGTWNRAKAGSTNWEDITIDITNSLTFSDTVYLVFGINCSGTGDVGGAGLTTIWYADDIELVEGIPPIQLGISQSFEGNNIGDAFAHMGWGAADLESVVAADPLDANNKVLQNSVHNYNAAPVVPLVIPAGKTLANYISFTFSAYFAQGDVGYKDIIVEAYQTAPTGPFNNNASAKIGTWTRAKMGSSEWEDITVDIANTLNFSDTVYLAFGISCSGIGDVGGTGVATIWYADDIELVEGVPPVQLGITQSFEDNNIGDTYGNMGWGPSDIEAVVAADPLDAGNKVLQNSVHNYNAAPVVPLVIPAGRTLADYVSFTFSAYFAQGDVGYKDIVVEAYQTPPTGPFNNNASAKIGSWNRAKMGSSAWEDITIDITNSSALRDTVYFAFGISCSGTGDVGGTGVPSVWYADDIALVEHEDSAGTNLVKNGSFENTELGVITSGQIEGWLIQVDTNLTAAPVFEIVNDVVQDGNHALKTVINSVGTNAWSIQLVADSIPVKPGETYNYSIWAKAANPGAQINITVGRYSFSEYSAIRPANLSTEWQEFKMQLTITDSQTVIRSPIHFSIAANVGNTIYIDNLKFSKLVAEEYDGPPLASKQPKFVGNVHSSPQIQNFEAYWNQVTPENAGKWGSVEGTRDVMNWGGLDAAYKFAKDNKIPFHFHVLIWGAQQPAWIDSLPPAEQLEEIREWFEAVAERYPDIDFLEVVNEPLLNHNPPDGTNGRANYKEALGGNGETGWDWVLNAFRMAKEIFPAGTRLMLNDFSIINTASSTRTYLRIIRLLKSEGLIDIIGEQGHAFTTTAAAGEMKNNLDSLHSTGIPIQITEMDVDGTDDQVQLQNYKRIFPTLYQHPGVEGITLWGWRRGLWRDNEGAYLLNEDGTERPALVWLRKYLDTVNVKPVSVDDIAGVPNEFRLYNNYPNPFNPATTISFDLPVQSDIRILLFDVLGRVVKEIASGVYSSGKHNITLNASDLSSGVYFYKIEAGRFMDVKKMVLLK